MLLISIPSILVSQEYQLTAYSGTFTPLISAVNVSEIQGDDAISNIIDIGFDFVCNGTSYTQIIASSNGFISLNPGCKASYCNSLSSPYSTQCPLIAPLNDDLSGDSGTASYKLEGTSPNRVFTFEWLNWKWNYNAESAVISFQVKLYETTNIIKYIYRPESGAVHSGKASIGLSLSSSISGGGGDKSSKANEVVFFSLSDSGTNPVLSSGVSTSDISVKPASGQVYQFEYLILPEPTNHVTNFKATNHNDNILLSWKDATGSVIPSKYLILASTTNSFTAPTDGTSVVTDSITSAIVYNGAESFNEWKNLIVGQHYYYRIYPCTNTGNLIDYKTNGTVPASDTIFVRPEPTTHVTNFATSISSGNIILNWTDATGDIIPDGYVIMASATNSFTNPVDGNEIISDNNLIDGAGVVKVANGVQTFNGWTNISLTSNYNFKIYPYTNSGSFIKYNTTAEVPMVSIKAEPTNHVANFAVTNSNSNLSLSWTDATGAQLPDGYLIMASTTNNFTDPVDGTDISVDNDLTDGTGMVKVNQGKQSYSSWNINSTATYYFKIYPYTNIGTSINYKTTAIVPVGNCRFTLKPEPKNHATSFAATNNNGIALSWVDGLNNALDFDGTNDYITCGNQNYSIFTAEAWVCPSVTNMDQAIISTLNESTLTGFEIHISTSGYPCVTLRNSSAWLDVLSPNLAKSGDWIHIAATFDGTTVKLYENGIQVASGTVSYNVGSSTLTLGKRSSGSLLYNGKLDEVRIWNTVRSVSEISSNMYLELAGTETGLKSYYKFNQGTAGGSNTSITTLTDTKAAYTGTLYGFSLTSTTSNFVNSYYAPDGYVIYASTTNSFTGPTDGNEITVDDNLADGSGVVKVAQDVKSFASWLNAQGSTTYYFAIYPYSNNGGFINYYTAATVPTTSLAFTKSSPIAHVTNLTASLNDPKIVLKWTDAKEISPNSGNALSLDGTNDFIAVPVLGSNLSTFTIETWLNASSICSSADFDGIYNSNSWITGAVHFQINDSKIEFAIGGATSNINISYSMATNTWLHLAATFNSGSVKIYVNGILVGSGNVSSTTANLAAAEIGAWNTSRYFTGKFDEYRIWGTERSPLELQNSMYSTLTGSESGLLAYYRFNQGIAGGTNTGLTTLTDISPNSKNGTLTNFTLSGTTSNWVGSFQAPDGYLIMASKTNSFTDPVDGTDITSDNNMADGVGKVKVAYGIQTYSDWTNLENTIPYYFKVYPYTNSGTSIKYNKTATVPQIQITSPFIQFEKVTSTAFENLYLSSTSWADYNNDGFLDALITGAANSSVNKTLLYLNNKNGTFTLQSSISFTGVAGGSAAWGDYDNDNDLDLLVFGNSSGGYVTKIYKNNFPTNSFTELTGIGLTGIYAGSASWGDYDKDGDLDILLSGYSNSGEISKVYRNNQDGTFTDMIEFDLVGVNGNAAWSDFDNDGDLDILLDGRMSNGYSTEVVYRNNNSGGNITFSKEKFDLYNLSELEWGNSVSGDFNNDGYLDIITSGTSRNLTGHFGWTPYPYQNNIHHNTGGSFGVGFSMLFDSTFQYFTGGYMQNVLFGFDGKSTLADYNNDGLIDIYITGRDYVNGGVLLNMFFKNKGAFSFTKKPVISITKLLFGTTSFGDYDNDGDLDIIQIGSPDAYGFTGVTELYKNNNTTAISTPTVPQNLSASTKDKITTFTWSKCTSGSNNALYAIRIGTTSGASNIVSAQALASTGARLLPGYEILLRDTSYTIKGLEPIDYFWTVQAVNQNGKGSAFAPQQTYTIDSLQANHMIANKLNSSSIKLKWKSGNGDGCIVFVSKETTLPASPTHGVTYRAIPQLVDGCKYTIGGKTWYCVFNGIADSVVITGLTPGVAYTCHVMEYFTKNNADRYLKSADAADANFGIFYTNDVTEQVLSSGTSYLSDWADYDKDGFLDVVASGLNSGWSAPGSTNLYHNNGDNTFTVNKTIITDIVAKKQQLVDFDNDGDLDLVLSGTYEYMSSDGHTLLYQNNGSGNYALYDTLTNFLASTEWGDYNNDGLPDILVIGEGNSRVYKNNGSGSFSEMTGISLPAVYEGFAIWGDYNNDGLLDILISGFDENRNELTKLYKNNGNGMFVEQTGIVVSPWDDPKSFFNLGESSASWGDYDNDGDLDLALMGAEESGGFAYTITKVYRNNYPLNNFTDIDVQSDHLRLGEIKWGDYNNDGKLDLILSGGLSSDNSYSKIYLNCGNDDFCCKPDLVHVQSRNSIMGRLR